MRSVPKIDRWPPRATAGRLPLGRAAGGGLLWFAAATVLAAGGGRFGRRAALRGLMAAALGSAVSRGAVKALGRRPRRPSPSTSSFPSAPAAAAFAFAAGAGQELPWLAAPLGGVATVVSYARAHTGVDDRGAVVTGAALGLAAGVVTRRFWPVAPHQPARAATAAPSAVAPSPEGAGLVMVVNPSAGWGTGPEGDLRAELPAAEIVVIEEGDDLEAVLRSAAERGEVLGVAGGDGTVNTAASVAAETGRRLVVVPGGTLNHFAAALGVSSVADTADAVRQGRAVAVDLGVIDGRTFVNTASIGGYVELVDARERFEARIGKWPAMVVALVQVLRRSSPVDLELDGRPARVWMIFVGNCAYHPAGFGPSWRQRLDDGRLDIRIVHASRPWSRLRLVVSVGTGQLARCRVYEQRSVTELRVRSRQDALRLARDGETFDGSVEFTITKAAEPLVVYAPRP